MKSSSHLVALAFVSIGLTACGGGGGGDDVATAPTPAPAPGPAPGGGLPTYGSTNLPGRLIVTDNEDAPRLFDLRTGLSTTAPWNSTVRTGWTVATGTSSLARTEPGANGTTSVQRIRATDGAALGAALAIGGTFNRPKYSPDGRYLLTFWQPGDDPNARRLIIADATTGQIVRNTSKLDNKIVTASPAAWLPNGNYLYLDGRDLYESSPTATVDTLRASLTGLPDNSVSQNNIDLVSEDVYLSVSPDGTRIAFNWRQRRGTVDSDTALWTANVNGTGLRQLTAAPDANSSLVYPYGSLAWSPDGQWIAGVLYMGPSAGTPVTLPAATFPDGSAVTGTTVACNYNPVFVLPASADRVAIGWPAYNANLSLKVRKADGTGGQWMATCGSVHWID